MPRLRKILCVSKSLRDHLAPLVTNADKRQRHVTHGYSYIHRFSPGKMSIHAHVYSPALAATMTCTWTRDAVTASVGLLGRQRRRAGIGGTVFERA